MSTPLGRKQANVYCDFVTFPFGILGQFGTFLYRFPILAVFSTFENVQWLFLPVPWVGRRCVIMVFLDHTHLLIYMCTQRRLGPVLEVYKSYQSGLRQCMRTPAKLL